jgi:hypothetical protein
MKEIYDEGLTDEAWNAAEARVRKKHVREERSRLRRLGRIRDKTIPTPLVPDPNGHIKCVGGQTYGFGHSTEYKGGASK